MLLEVVRPRAKKVETAGVVLYTMLFASHVRLLVDDAFSANDAMATSRILQEAVFTFSMYASLGIYWAGFRPIYVEFRERGLVCGPHFWPWESIREWNLSDGGPSLLLKMPDRINTYGIARRDAETVEAILEEHLGPARQRSSPVGQVSGAQRNATHRSATDGRRKLRIAGVPHESGQRKTRGDHDSP